MESLEKAEGHSHVPSMSPNVSETRSRRRLHHLRHQSLWSHVGAYLGIGYVQVTHLIAPDTRMLGGRSESVKKRSGIVAKLQWCHSRRMTPPPI